jgi:hypothetical protein
MAKKVALLIGVSQYEAGLPPLPAAPNDVEAMRRVLEDPKLGGFDMVNPLINPDPIAMQRAIHQLFADCQKDDLALLFFSGHGITDDNGRLYLTTRITDGSFFKATSVPASFLHDVMNESRCQRQVIILDCCYSGAFAEGWQPRSHGAVDPAMKKEFEKLGGKLEDLGGKGRAVLTSSSALHKSFEHEGAGIYTRYLVEGIETGAADRDGSGAISIQELHEYAKEKVQAAKPSMKPEFYPHKEGFNILLAQARKSPEAEYRKIVEHYANQGEISDIARFVLQQKQTELGITDKLAAEIESQILEPYRRRLKNLELYREAFKKAVEYRYPLAQKTRDELKDLQDVFGLRDEDVAPIEEQFTTDKKAKHQQQQQAQTQPQQAQSTLTAPSKLNNETDDLSSKRGVDYTNLQNLLKAGKWKEADQETLAVMLKAANREKEACLDIESIENFPCIDLRTINQLWVKYSNGQFGFSVQKRIWESVGGKPGEYDQEIIKQFGDRVGWRKRLLGFVNYETWLSYSEITFTLDAPSGHLPLVGGMNGLWDGVERDVSFFSRLETCDL